MSSESLTIESAIKEIRNELNIAYDERTLADDVQRGALDVTFFCDSCIFELDNPLNSIRLEQTFIKLHTIEYCKANLVIDIQFSNCFNIINEDTQAEILTVKKEDKTYLLAPRDAISNEEIFKISPLSVPLIEYRELIQPKVISKNQLRVTRPSLNKYLSANLSKPVEFKEGKVAEMNSDKALAIMAIMLSEASTQFKIGNRPNSARIADEIYTIATKLYPKDEDQMKGLQSFHKRISKALKSLESN